MEASASSATAPALLYLLYPYSRAHAPYLRPVGNKEDNQENAAPGRKPLCKKHIAVPSSLAIYEAARQLLLRCSRLSLQTQLYLLLPCSRTYGRPALMRN